MAQNAVMETGSPRRTEEIGNEFLQAVDVEDTENVLLEIDNKSELDNQNRFWKHLQSEDEWCETLQASSVEKMKDDPYDSFMRRHLEHYGYFTGRNASFRNNFDGLENWHRNYDLRLSGTHSLSVDDDHLKKMGHFKSHKNIPMDPGLGQFFAEGQPPDDLLSRTTQLVFHYQAGKKIPKLREPRNLYALTKEPGPQQATRWPSHMQVVSSPIHFIEYTPKVPDPFYEPTGKEATPAVRGTPSGEIVYLNDPGRDFYFMRSRVAGCRLAMRDISLTPRDTVDQGNFTLEFESRFESGNLLKAVKINDYDYELTLRPDLYTDKHTQWYFFRVKNMVPGKPYRLTIVNLMKPSSLYNNGMKPLFYSDADAKKNKIGWTRAGSDIRYYRNNLGSLSGRTFYSLTWTMEFPHKDDTCFFAHCYPYTYTDLQEYLLKLANDPVRSRFCKQRVLCRTLAGNLVYILTVTSPSRNPEIARAKKAVVLTARVHPGETNSSWMMKGFLDFLSGSTPDAKLLRDNFIFKIVPMLNPDGVIVGNYRCSLSGRDLNRNYKSVLKDSFPSVWHTKMMIKRLHVEREIVLYCDLHGHSRKNNIFIYGCENKNNPQRKLKERIFPLMLAKNADTKFSYESCKFKVQKSKEGTGRVVVWLMGVMNSYTMEATFGGTTLGSRKGTHFSSRDLEEMGHNFCDTLLDYCDPDTSKTDACYQEIQDRLRKQILKRMQMRNGSGSLGDVDIDDYSSDYESDTSGSDSSCDDGLPVHLLAIAPKLQRKRRLKTRRDRNKQSLRKPSSTGHDDAKPTPSHGAKPILDKAPKPVRYSQTAGGKRREENNPAVSVGTTPQATAFHADDNARAAKKIRHPPPWKVGHHDPDKKAVFSLLPTSQAVAFDSKPPLLPQDHISKRELSFKITQRRSDYLEALTTAYIRSGVLMVPDKKNAEEQYEILRRSALRRQLSPAQQRILAQRHLAAVAHLQQRKEQATTMSHRPVISATEVRRGSGTPLKQHPNPFEADELGQSVPHSRCASATWRQDTVRKIQAARSASPPSSNEAAIRSSSARTITTSSKSAVPSSDSTYPFQKSRAFDSSSDTPAADKKLTSDTPSEQTLSSNILPRNRQTMPNNSEGCKTSSDNISSISSSMHSHGMEVDNKNIDDSTFGEQIATNVRNAGVIKEKPDLGLGRLNNSVIETTITDDVKSFEEVSATMPNEAIEDYTKKPTPQDIAAAIGIKSSIEKAKTIAANSVFGELLDTTLDKGLKEKIAPREVVGSPGQRVRMKPNSQASILTNDTFGPNEVSMEKIPKQWGGKKQLVVLDVKEANSPEPVKRDRPRALSGKKNPLSNVIAEGHTSRVRVKTYQGNGDTETYFGMSDQVGMSGNIKHGERVPPVVANIAELRRSLMGQGRDGKDEEPNIKGIPPPNLAKQKNPNDEKVQKRRSINLRPRAHTRFAESIFEDPAQQMMNGEENSRVESASLNHQTSHGNDSTKSCTGNKVDGEITDAQKSSERKGRRRTPPNHRNIENATRREHNSGEIEEYVEEKWPTANEIRTYSQGNATIEKLNDHSLTSIRFGARTSEHTRRIREQWIDVHQRQVVQSSISNRQDMLSMSSVSLNIEGDIDEKLCATTPALAKRPVPPMLRYLSAKQTTKRKW